MAKAHHSRRDFFRKSLASLGEHAADAVQRKLERAGVGAEEDPEHTPLDSHEIKRQVSPTGFFDRKYFRPPGAVPEQEFLDMCSACNACVEACPEQCILSYNAERDEKRLMADADLPAGSPFMLPNETACTMGGDCMDICPSGALLPTPQEFIRIGLAAIKATTCIAFGEEHCTLCYDACPTTPNAIEFPEEFHGCSPEINPDICTGCGICVSSCPTDSKSIEVYPRPVALDIDDT